MESKVFTARLSHRAIAAVGNLSEAANELWPRLNRMSGEYIAQSLGDQSFQLLRCIRELTELPREHCVELRLIVEARQVTTRSRMDVIGTPSRGALDLAQRVWGDMTGEDLNEMWPIAPQPLRPTQPELQAIQDLQNAMGPMPQQNPFGSSDAAIQERLSRTEVSPLQARLNQDAFERAFGIAKQTPEELPISGRKVLVHKHQQPA